MPKKLLFKSFLSPGDILMLTAALRDLHLQYPGDFVTDVRSSCPYLWENNPGVTPLDETDPETRSLDCHYPLIHGSNQSSYHFIQGYLDFFNQTLGLDIKLRAFKGDIHLSEEERAAPSVVAEVAGGQTPYWILSAGGKYDYSIKWWHHRRYQQVVDYFRGRILFVQIGEEGHFHPPIVGALDLRGKTPGREIIRLTHGAQGVLCPVTFLMHLAAAVDTKDGFSRPCVVVAGGREPPQWEAYPTHQYIHTVGSLPCCRDGGCWRARIVPLGLDDEHDQPKHLCVDVTEGLPRCMDMITPEEVIGRIELYFKRPSMRYLREEEYRDVKGALTPSYAEAAAAALGL